MKSRKLASAQHGINGDAVNFVHRKAIVISGLGRKSYRAEFHANVTLSANFSRFEPTERSARRESDFATSSGSLKLPQ
jgi:hypothetical protein